MGGRITPQPSPFTSCAVSVKNPPSLTCQDRSLSGSFLPCLVWTGKIVKKNNVVSTYIFFISCLVFLFLLLLFFFCHHYHHHYYHQHHLPASSTGRGYLPLYFHNQVRQEERITRPYCALNTKVYIGKVILTKPNLTCVSITITLSNTRLTVPIKRRKQSVRE